MMKILSLESATHYRLCAADVLRLASVMATTALISERMFGMLQINAVDAITS